MLKRVHIALAAVLLALAGVMAWLVLREREPVYQGEPLSFWLEGNEFNSMNSGQIDALVRQIGTNSLPNLLRMLRAKDSPLRLKLMRIAQGQPFLRERWTPARTLNYSAVNWFGHMGAEAKNAVPELVEMYKRTPGFGPAGPGAALGAIGPAAAEAIPSLLLNVGNTNAGAREIAVEALGLIHCQPQAVVPVLIEALRDPAMAVQSQALLALGRYGTEAKAAVPALLEVLKTDPDPDKRQWAAWALGQIHHEPQEVVPALVTALHDPYVAVGIKSVCALGDFGPEAKTSVPAVLEFLRSLDDAFCKSLTTNALKAIDPEAAAKAGVK